MHSLCIIKMILVLKAQTWSYFSCYDCNFLSSFSFAGADKCFDACETTPFCPDFYTCVLPNSNMALSTAIINHTYKWMAFKRVCLSIMEWNIFVAVFLKGCLSCNGCFKTCIVSRFCWLFLHFSILLSKIQNMHKIILSGAWSHSYKVWSVCFTCRELATG